VSDEPDIILKGPRDVKVALGEPFQLEIILREDLGQEQVYVEWACNNEIIEEEEDVFIDVNRNVGRLVFRSCIEMDEGLYEVRVKERATGKVQLKKCAVEITKGVSEFDGKYEIEKSEYSTEKSAEPFKIDSNIEYFNQRFSLMEKIGEGRFGKVHKCKDKTVTYPGQGLYAVKIYRGLPASEVEMVEQEISILREIQHPQLVQLLGVYKSLSKINLLFELVEGGELFDRFVDDDFLLTEELCQSYMRQICI